MRLYELTGYKSHPLYHAVKGMRDNPSSDPSSQFDPWSMHKVINQMEQVGWHKMPKGHGYYSNVFENPKYPYIVKIFYDDEGYSQYLDMMMKNQSNPHVPKLRGKQMKINNKTSAVRIERLEPINGIADPIFKKYAAPGLPPTFGNVFENPKNHEFLQTEYPQLWDIFQKIENSGRFNDISTKNLMRRGNDIVITDPLT